MINVLETNEQILNSIELTSLLTGYNLLPQLIRELVIDRAIYQWQNSTHVSLSFTDEEINNAQAIFYQQHQVIDSEQEKIWLESYGINKQQLMNLLTRQLKIEKFQQANWGKKIEAYFLQRKKYLDRVVYSMIRTRDLGISQELYFRIQADENSFGKLAKNYSRGVEANTNGIVGPIEMGKLHPGLARQLQISQPGQLWQPVSFGEYFVIIRLEKLLPAELDDVMHQRLMRELFEVWLKEEIQNLSHWEKSELIKNLRIRESG